MKRAVGSRSHDVKNCTNVGVFRIGEFLVSASLIISLLDFAIDLATVGALKINTVISMCLDRPANEQRVT
jgi:hypothetical protein